MPEMEMAGGGYNAQAGVTTTVKAVVRDKNGKVIADLGTIVGPRTKEEGRKTDKLLKKLKVEFDKEEKKQKKEKEMRNNG